jgi:hypothetical protein
MSKTTLIIAALCVVVFSKNSYAVDFATKDYAYQTTSTAVVSAKEAANDCKCDCNKKSGFKKSLSDATETVAVTGAWTVAVVAGTAAAVGTAGYDAARSGVRKLFGKK